MRALRCPGMRQRTVISGAAAAAALAAAAAVAAAPRAWRRLRRREAEPEVVESPFTEPLGDPEAPFDPEANAALREELRDRISTLDETPAPPPTPPVEVLDALDATPPAASDPETEAARARLREKAAAAKRSFSS